MTKKRIKLYEVCWKAKISTEGAKLSGCHAAKDSRSIVFWRSSTFN